MHRMVARAAMAPAPTVQRETVCLVANTVRTVRPILAVRAVRVLALLHRLLLMVLRLAATAGDE